MTIRGSTLRSGAEQLRARSTTATPTEVRELPGAPARRADAATDTPLESERPNRGV
jgi:hypothetical protein